MFPETSVNSRYISHYKQRKAGIHGSGIDRMKWEEVL